MNIDYFEEVKRTLQDYPELNHILLERNDGEEHSSEEIEHYIKRALARINMRPPVTTYTLDRFPQSQYLLIVDGAVIEALQIKGLLKLRNDMPYQDQGGTSVQLDGKGQRYFQTASSLYHRWMEEVKMFKEGLSVRDAWGGVASDFNRNFW